MRGARVAKAKVLLRTIPTQPNPHKTGIEEQYYVQCSFPCCVFLGSLAIIKIRIRENLVVLIPYATVGGQREQKKKNLSETEVNFDSKTPKP